MNSFQILVWIAAVVPFIATFILFRMLALAGLRLFGAQVPFGMGGSQEEDTRILDDLGAIKYVLASGILLLGLPLFVSIVIYVGVIELYDRVIALRGGILYAQSLAGLVWELVVSLTAGVLYGLWSWSRLRTRERGKVQASQ